VVEQIVDGITISGNFYDLLQNIQGISNEWSDSFSSVKVPDLLVSGFKVSG
jgi:PmbA protein